MKYGYRVVDNTKPVKKNNGNWKNKIKAGFRNYYTCVYYGVNINSDYSSVNFVRNKISNQKFLKMTTKIIWPSDPPSLCEICKVPITNIFYDARIIQGPCACMCPSCFMFGPGGGKLGSGFGQKYEKKYGKWVKTGG